MLVPGKASQMISPGDAQNATTLEFEFCLEAETPIDNQPGCQPPAI